MVSFNKELHGLTFEKPCDMFFHSVYAQCAAFKKMSTSEKANRAKYAVGDKIPGTHNMGYISSIELAERMIRENEEGIIPTAFDLFIQAHTHNGKLADKRAEEIKEKYESRKTQLQEKGEEFVENDLFAEVVGGFKKGRLYGIGSAADYYYKDKSTCSSSMIDTSTTATSYVGIGVLGRVQAESAKVLEENAKLKEENQKIKQETDARFKVHEEMIMKMGEELRTINPSSQFTSFR